MNAARPIFSAAFSATSSPSPAAPASSPKKRAHRASKNAAGPAEPEAPCDEYSACMVQARICREQAQEAARLKRFKAAVGLFQTAICLCQRAVTLRKSPQPSEPTLHAPEETILASDAANEAVNDGEARAYLQVLAVELSAYDELARSMNRPFINRGR